MANIDYIIDGDKEQILIETIQKETKNEVIEAYVQCRKELGMTQQDLADVTGIARPNITRFEGGKYNPSLEMLVRIAVAMGKKVKVTLEE